MKGLKNRMLLSFVLLMLILFLSTAFFLPKLVVRNNEDKKERAHGMIKIISDALERFYHDNGRYPNTDEGLELLTIKNDKEKRPYLNGLPADPWRSPFQYRNPGTRYRHSYDLWSYGADEKPGGDGQDADIYAQRNDRTGLKVLEGGDGPL